MPSIDFREIPKAHNASGQQDTYELFARDFFTDILKFKVLSEPSRGADGGKDILCEEQQFGTLSDNKEVWLISCKHKAHSGNSVTPDDEYNISDRLTQFSATGFIGFYSTLASGGLNTRLDSFKGRYKVEVFDKEKIEDFILGHKRYELFKRYFPISYKRWFEIESKNEPSQILGDYEPLTCEVCGIDLLKVDRSDDNNHGIIGFVMHREHEIYRYIDCYAACVGKCDRKMVAVYASLGYFTAWDALNDLLIPTLYLRRYMAILNRLVDNNLEFEPEAFRKYKQMLIAISQYVFRHQSEKEIVRIKKIIEIPEGL